MNKDILFSEKQRFQQWWLWLVLFIVNGALLGIALSKWYNIFNHKSINNFDLGVIIFSIILAVLITILVKIICLETYIKKDGIYIRFFPFHIKFKFYGWHTLSKVYTREYAPLSEYGGWGIRWNLWGKGMAYNIRGNQGLQLEFTTKEKLLIGTQKPQEISLVLNKIGKFKS